MKVVVVGTGYVGLVTAVTLAYIGHKVTCIDKNTEKINKLKECICPIYEEDLEELMLKNKKRLRYSDDYKDMNKKTDIIMICVGTPENRNGSVYLKYVWDVVKKLAKNLKNNCTIVIKSTVPMGTNEKIEDYLKKHVKKRLKVHVVSNPEFLSQGTAIKDTLYASRIVVGTEDKKSEKLMHKLYKPLIKKPYNVPYICVKRKTAEMIKYASNNFLALKISYINELANLCKIINVDIEDVAKGMGFDPRIGNKFLKSGIGYGGSCFPKDTKALYNYSQELNIDLKTVQACIDINTKQKTILFNKLKEIFSNLEGLTVAILGLTFKPGTDDVRESPALDNLKLLLEVGVKVKAYDPIGIENFQKVIKRKRNLKYFKNIDETIKDCDAVMIMTEWPEIINYDINKFIKLMKQPYIFDGRNCYKLNKMKKYKLNYYSIGREDIKNIKL